MAKGVQGKRTLGQGFLVGHTRRYPVIFIFMSIVLDRSLPGQASHK